MSLNIGIDIRPLMTTVRTGVGEYTYELLNSVFDIDSENRYFLFFDSQADIWENILHWHHPNVHYINTGWPRRLLNAAIQITNYPRLDKLICHQARSDFRNLDYFFSPNLNFSSLSPDTKSILTIHDLSYEFFPEFFTKKQQLWHHFINPPKQCRRADIIIAPSHNTKQDIIDYYHICPDKIRVIYPGLKSMPRSSDQAAIQKKYGLPAKYILFLGTIEPRKNIIALIEAFERVKPRLEENYYLVIAGANGWKNQEIYQRLKNSPYQSSIKILNYINETDKPTIYALADLFVYPSFYEGFGFPVLEAMKMSTPVITSSRSSLPEVTSNAACLINPNDPLALSEGIYTVLKNNQLKNRLIENGLKQTSKFSWSQSAEQWLSLLQL